MSLRKFWIDFKDLIFLILAIIRATFFIIAYPVLNYAIRTGISIKSWYYRTLFPNIMQAEIVMGDEGRKLVAELMAIREASRLAYEGFHAGTLSKSQLKKINAKTHNAESAFFANNNLIVRNGILYRKNKR
jgi:hypothetical protein